MTEKSHQLRPVEEVSLIPVYTPIVEQAMEILGICEHQVFLEKWSVGENKEVYWQKDSRLVKKIKIINGKLLADDMDLGDITWHPDLDLELGRQIAEDRSKSLVISWNSPDKKGSKTLVRLTPIK